MKDRSPKLLMNLARVIFIILPVLIPGHVRIAYGWLASFILYACVSVFAASYYFYKPSKAFLFMLCLAFIFLPVFTFFDNREFWYPFLMPSYLFISLVSFLISYSIHNRRAVISLISSATVIIFIGYTFNKLDSYLFVNTINPFAHSSLTNEKKSIQLIGVDLFKTEVLSNKVVILDFWYTSCAPCINKHAAFDSLASHYADRKDVVFLSVVDGKLDTRQKLANFMKTHSIKTKVLYDSAGVFSEQLSLSKNGYPLELRINKRSRVWEIVNGYTDSKNLYISQGISSINKQL